MKRGRSSEAVISTGHTTRVSGDDMTELSNIPDWLDMEAKAGACAVYDDEGNRWNLAQRKYTDVRSCLLRKRKTDHMLLDKETPGVNKTWTGTRKGAYVTATGENPVAIGIAWIKDEAYAVNMGTPAETGVSSHSPWDAIQGVIDEAAKSKANVVKLTDLYT